MSDLRSGRSDHTAFFAQCGKPFTQLPAAVEPQPFVYTASRRFFDVSWNVLIGTPVASLNQCTV